MAMVNRLVKRCIVNYCGICKLHSSVPADILLHSLLRYAIQANNLLLR
jgi:hypothetical protein